MSDKTMTPFDKTKASFVKTMPMICLFSTATSSYKNVEARSPSYPPHKVRDALRGFKVET